MNWNKLIVLVLVISLTLTVKGQVKNSLSEITYLKPYELEIACNKTTIIVFPSSIASVDRGSKDILVKNADGIDNVLRVKADAKNFEQTNLSVITNDGRLYSFTVNYNDMPSHLNINIGNKEFAKSEIVFSSDEILDETKLRDFALQVRWAKANIFSIVDSESKMEIELNGFYINGNILFCKLQLSNQSQINYDIDQFRIYIRDRKKSKRTASQEIEIRPIKITGNAATIAGNSDEFLVIALPKFTIPDDKYLVIEMMEKNGGRNLQLKVKGKHIIKAQAL